MTCEFVFFRQIQIEIALSKPTSERRNSLTIRTYCSCSVTLSPSSSHRIHGSVKLLYSEIRGGWEKWNNIFSIGIFLITSCERDFWLQESSQHNFLLLICLHFLKLLRAESVMALRTFLHVLLSLPVSFLASKIQFITEVE